MICQQPVSLDIIFLHNLGTAVIRYHKQQTTVVNEELHLFVKIYNLSSVSFYKSGKSTGR